jgi:hypothetical protein
MTPLRDFGQFLIHEKKWYVTGILIALLALGNLMLQSIYECQANWSQYCARLEMLRIR